MAEKDQDGPSLELPSTAISGGSQPVSASAPMKMYSPPDSSREVVPIARLRKSIASSNCWRKGGQPANPPLTRDEFRRLVRSHTKAALETLVEVVAGEHASIGVRLSAARTLLQFLGRRRR